MSVLFTSRSVRSLASVLALGIASIAAPARADGPGPAYLIEPGEAPANSVPMVDPADPSAAPEAVSPEETTPADEAAADALYDAAPEATEPSAPSVADDDPRALSEFTSRLDPYGTWTSDPSYGQVWRPDFGIVGSEFSPYLTAGHWAVDPSGAQTWVSDYPFGDIVFHYGRWVWISAGWAWVPGYRYAPAWVAWRLPVDASGYYGWAPLPPSFVWVNQAPVGLPWRSSYYWVFCPGAFVHAPSPASYVVHSPAEAQAIAPHTRAYVPATPRRSAAGAPAAPRALASRQAWAPGYRPVIRARAAVHPMPGAGAPAPMNGVSAPHMAAVAAPRPQVMAARPPGATVMQPRAVVPVRVPVAAPHVFNAAAPMRASPAVFRGHR